MGDNQEIGFLDMERDQPSQEGGGRRERIINQDSVCVCGIITHDECDEYVFLQTYTNTIIFLNKLNFKFI